MDGRNEGYMWCSWVFYTDVKIRYPIFKYIHWREPCNFSPTPIRLCNQKGISQRLRSWNASHCDVSPLFSYFVFYGNKEHLVAISCVTFLCPQVDCVTPRFLFSELIPSLFLSCLILLQWPTLWEAPYFQAEGSCSREDVPTLSTAL